jgi:phospholipase/carboxylesterase
MSETERRIAGLRTRIVTAGRADSQKVVVLHGYAMTPEDLVPFAHSIGVDATFYFPEGPVAAEPRGRAWWPIDQERRSAALALGARDLHEERPEGAPAARSHLAGVIGAVRAIQPRGAPLTIVGFSQGGMLACDLLLRERIRVEALAMLSSSRISAAEWEPLGEGVRGLPVLVSHGRADDDLAFAAGEALKAFLERSGARVTWLPFDGGHEIPLVVWRGLRKLLAGLRPPETPRAAPGGP